MEGINQTFNNIFKEVDLFMDYLESLTERVDRAYGQN